MRRREIRIVGSRDDKLIAEGHLWPVNHRGEIVASRPARGWWVRFVDVLLDRDELDREELRWMVACQRCGVSVDKSFVRSRSYDPCSQAPTWLKHTT